MVATCNPAWSYTEIDRLSSTSHRKSDVVLCKTRAPRFSLEWKSGSLFGHEDIGREEISDALRGLRLHLDLSLLNTAEPLSGRGRTGLVGTIRTKT